MGNLPPVGEEKVLIKQLEIFKIISVLSSMKTWPAVYLIYHLYIFSLFSILKKKKVLLSLEDYSVIMIVIISNNFGLREKSHIIVAVFWAPNLINKRHT